MKQQDLMREKGSRRRQAYERLPIMKAAGSDDRPATLHNEQKPPSQEAGADLAVFVLLLYFFGGLRLVLRRCLGFFASVKGSFKRRPMTLAMAHTIIH
jgi:hypothetical protein